MKFKDYKEKNGIKSIIKSDNIKPCLICKELTPYIEVFSESHFCSEECVDKFYEQVTLLEE